ncbi:ComEC/Rec2 family competence protein [Candidatus Saccharibacteria bacterium]|nr:ComEC/Rec2 family competence protein [Candidatus Saccharibacteria bacterium]
MDKKYVVMTALEILLGAAVVFWAVTVVAQKTGLEQMVGEVADISGKVKGDPTVESNQLNLKLNNLNFGGENIRGVIYVSGLPKYDIERGDTLTLRAKLGEGFGGFAASLYAPEVLNVKKQEPRSLMLAWRETFATKVKNNLETKEAGLGLGYLMGMKNELDEETQEMIRLVGLSHIIVASGTHLGIIVEIVKKYFGRLSRFSGMLFSFLLVLGFGELIGWTASITRAAIVALVSLLAWYVGREIEAWRIILFAVVITLIIDPTNIVDLGWQMSFAAFFGVMVVAPRLTEFFYGKNPKAKPGVLAQTMLASLAATITCLPLLIYYYGTVSAISIFANVLILPTMPLAMGLTFLTGLLGMMPAIWLFDVAQWLVNGTAKLVLDYHLFVMEIFAQQKSFILNFSQGKIWVLGLYLGIFLPIIFGSLLRAQKNRKKRVPKWEDSAILLPQK